MGESKGAAERNDSEDLNVKLINMEKSHVPYVAAIESEIFSAPWSEQAFADTLAMENVIFLIASVNGRVAGYCGIYLAADEGEITNVAVAASYRRHKIAWMLLHETMEKAREKGAQRIFLEVRSRNEPAIQLYRKTGFQKTGVRRNYYTHPDDDALVMMHDSADK